MNPVPYRARFYGEKIHLDQNEKLVMYGIVHVVAVDGYSRKVVGFSTMPRKNPITIYNTIFRPLLVSDGIWDQVRTDQGTEFTLVATMQRYLASQRMHQERDPVLQTTSRQNHRAERIWPEVNARINYPLKAVLVLMEDEEVISMRNEVHKFCVSWVTIQVVAPAVTTFVRAWNSHRLPGRNGGIPNELAVCIRQISPLLPQFVPSVSEAVALHEEAGGRLVRESTYGRDPIEHYAQLRHLRERDFFAVYPSMEVIFSDVLHNHGAMLRQAILMFISLSEQFSAMIST